MKIIYFISIIVVLISCSKNEKIKYNFIGEYDYIISDNIKFNETFLSQNSFGYTFGDLEIQGVEINTPKNLKKNNNKQYIIILIYNFRQYYYIYFNNID